ncbi:MAG: AAA family ATPase [Candidatus Kapabacteria bacterium]|nr:AAA family ATPase [Candidatus Kapabacteria bacterium]
MKINSFKADNVHDYLKFDINFFPDITFLIGINGSGKTSALKLILGLTSPSYLYLNQVNYKYCEVVCSSTQKEKNIIIRADQNNNDNTFIISLTVNEDTFSSGPIKRFSRNESNQYDFEELSQIEQRNKEYFDELDVCKKIRELTTPKFLGLDRRIYEGVNADFRYRNRRHTQFNNSKYRSRKYDGFPEPQAIDLSLEEVQMLVFDFIRQIPQQQFQISDDFKEKLFKESFKFYEDSSMGKIPPTKEIIERKDKVLKAIEDLGIKYINFSINDFFRKVEKIAEEFEQSEQKDREDIFSPKFREIMSQWYLNGNQLKRIDDIITYSQDYQKKIVELKAPLKKLEELTSNFLGEGKKVLRTETDGELKIKLKNGKSANIYDLSSGEKQIIIMIAHLIFEEAQKTSGIFIIDEPELSLHIAWQEIFVQSIMQASPNTQFILATHAPSIIAKVDKEKHCQDLNKFNF